jgi:riboflavin synthase
MFTGIISAYQPILQITDANSIRTCKIGKPSDWRLDIGESASVDGVCSTVVSVSDTDFVVEYMPETLRVTTLNFRIKNDSVNLERSLRLQDVVSGHLVTGHVDATGTISAIRADGDAHVLTITHAVENSRYLISKGSVAVNGISLTVVDPHDTQFSVAIIPHTWKQTNLHLLHIGERVNLEYDMLAKYVAQNILHG